MEKIDGLSMDMDKVELDKLAAVFPQCFVEGKLVLDKLLALLGEYDTKDFERYEFTWKGKSECLPLAQKRSTGTLRPCPEESVNFDNTQNLYIEGDNLEVLKLLQTPYYRQVKMIYIDPPYNTGNDFVYEDDFADTLAHYKEVTSQATKSNPESMGRFHTNWLNMMYPRLRLAANLLRDDGVIFISIDDNEVHNLRKICDEIFGEENFVSQLAIQVNPRGRHLDRYVAKTHEHVVIYIKSYGEVGSISGLEKEGKMLVEYNREDEKGKYRLLGLRNRNQSFTPQTRPNLYFPLYVDPSNGKISISQGKDFSEEVFPDTSDGVQTCWTWSKAKVMDENHLLVAERSGSEWRIFRKDYLLGEDGVATTLAKSLWDEKDITNDYGRSEIKDLFGSPVMDFPKSPFLLKKIIRMGSSKDSLVLDFFSGSATTAHAVMQLNAEDGGNRRFIMVQLPELCDEKSEAFKAGYKNICEIGKERIRRAGKKIQASAQKLDNGKMDTLRLDGDSGQDGAKPPLDTGFKVFKLDTSNLKTWDNSPIRDEDLLSYTNRFNNMVDRVKADRTDLDIVYEIMLKMGVPLTYSVTPLNIGGKIAYGVGDDCLLLICLTEGITPELVEQMAEYAPAKIILAEHGLADDTAMSNAHYILRDRGIELKLV